MRAPRDPIAAVIHPDPYPYYADLAASAPLARDEALGMWIAASRATASAVLTSDACAVRPPDEPVPRAIAGNAAGDLFGRLARMRDGARHRALRETSVAILGTVDRVAEASAACARSLGAALGPDGPPEDVTVFARALPVRTMAGLLGADEDDWPEIEREIDALAAAFAPGCDRDRAERGGRAAGSLTRRMYAMYTDRDDDRVASAIGLLIQTYEATAALLGNALVALGRHAALRALVAQDPGRIAAVVADVLRLDPPVQNTRRFVVRSGTVAGFAMNEGDAILVVLAAAATDAGPGGTFAFGAGPHACPGASTAAVIAAAGVRQVLDAGIDPSRLPFTYRPSVNVRSPQFR
jgi:cytochrome P450